MANEESVLTVKRNDSEGGEPDLKNKGTIVVMAVALALLVSAGIAIAAGVSGSGPGACAPGSEARKGTSIAGEALSFGCRNAAEESRIRAMNCAGEENGECPGDCERIRLRECECDGECDGDGTQSRNGRQEDGAAVTGQQSGSGARSGGCTGDCTRDRLCDGSCDGECETGCTQGRSRSGN
jgi:hypothetical protein